MDLIQSNGQPRYGRFKDLPTTINVNQYLYKTPYGKTLTGWRKQLKYKKFKFCSIQHEQYTIGIAIADIGWAGHGFIYLYNHVSQEALEWNANTILGRGTVVDEQPLYSQSYFTKSPFEFEMQHANGVRYIQVTRHGEQQLKARIFCAGTEPLSLCSPNGINGWTYTQKKTTLAVEGFFINKNKETIHFNEKTLASLDDTCGFLRPETAWFWLSTNFWDKKGQRIGVNLASGVNESFGNENCLWVNGVLYPLSDVLFEKLDENVWSIRSLNQKLQLVVETGWRRFENLNLRLVGSQFSQWQSKVSGTIETESGEMIELEYEYALLEQHYAKW
ncbi:DUF2804 domain-containing protein [Acinetobacter rongchengensis]|uniref:DUF2804 domain-containing protein n=1 Tax=Acinetobacter rongchengensis TaxID=2419601 RepID=A0A3A8EW75_9GAMM|nr:DUF2804 domain-containing protein [Acinetobacter rongchengensis]RKG38409.1 DUF2804 domain-containing protein [Acinetobacter rongchengensis]